MSLWNDKNYRKLKKAWARALQSYMREGDFTFNYDSVMFDENGNLLNGQHRMTAAVAAKMPLRVVVIRGVPAEVGLITTVDRGLARTLHDELLNRGEQNVNRLVVALVQSWHYERSQSPIPGRTQKIPVLKMVAFLNENPEIRESVAVAGRYGIAQCLRTGTGAFCHFAMTRACGGSELPTLFFRDFAKQVGLKEGDPALLLRRRLEQNRKRSVARLHNLEKAALTIKAWNAWVRQLTISRLVWYPRTESFPVCIGDGVE